MNKFGPKGKITGKDFMIHILNSLPKENDVILDGLENHLTASRDDALAMKVIHKKVNLWHGKLITKIKK